MKVGLKLIDGRAEYGSTGRVGESEPVDERDGCSLLARQAGQQGQDVATVGHMVRADWLGELLIEEGQTAREESISEAVAA